MSEIKDLLGKAIGQEPPLGIDRDEVFRAGRQKVRRRRTFAASGVVAAVVVAAVGAATLTNFVEIGPEPLPPAASDSQHAPPGPDLPLPSTPTSEKPVKGRPPLTAEHATQLTYRLLNSGIVSAQMVMPWPGRNDGPGFRVVGDLYLFESDLTTGKGEGILQVTVNYANPGSEATCEDIRAEYNSCVTSSTAGMTVARATWNGNGGGEKRNLAVVVLPDGTKVAAMTSNFSMRYQDADKRPEGVPPVLDMEDLTRLIVKTGFSVF